MTKEMLTYKELQELKAKDPLIKALCDHRVSGLNLFRYYIRSFITKVLKRKPKWTTRTFRK